MKKRKKLTFVFWILYLLLEINLEFAWSKIEIPDSSWIQRLLESVATETSFLVVKIPLVYILFYIIENEKTIRNLLSKFALASVTFILAICLHRLLVHDFFWPIIFEKTEKLSRFHIMGLFNAMMDLLFVFGIFFGFEKFLQQIDWKQQIADLRAEKMETELKFLKTQINPHFLFNTLNNIYGLALKNDAETPAIILKLSKIMRYNIYESSNQEVTLFQEVENMKDYITIQKIRYRNLQVSFQEEMEDASRKIAPLILLQFVENAFKYGASESIEDAFINVKIQQQKEKLLFEVANSIAKKLELSSSKIGLQNIQRQLELLYPNAHELKIVQENAVFQITLQLVIPT